MIKPWVDKELMCENTRSLSELKVIGYWAIWLEKSLFDGKRRSVLIGYDTQNSSKEKISILIPDNAEIGSSVHEYGGGSWNGWMDTNQQLNLIYVDAKRGGIYLFANSREIEIAPAEGSAGEKYFYADFDKSQRSDFIVCVRETRFKDHTEQSELLRINLITKEIDVLEEEADFYAFPRLSEDGEKLSWVEWNNPFMPWDRSSVQIKDLQINKRISISSQSGEYSTTEPSWHGSKLWFLTEQDGLMRPACYDYVENKTNLLPDLKQEAGLPLWQLDQRTYSVLDQGRVIVKVNEMGKNTLKVFIEDLGWQTVSGVSPEFIPCQLKGGSFLAISTREDIPKEIVHFRIKDQKAVRVEIIRKSNSQWNLEMTKKVKKPLFLEISSQVGLKNPITALFYPATEAGNHLDGSMLVRIHGGPTAQCNASCDPNVQFWTSRGIAVLDVNYRGSAGYGKEFREALVGSWGVADVEDCISAAEYAIKHKLAAADKCFIRGSSAGGFTVLSALLKKPGLFRAGCVRYGVSDLADLLSSSHRFEAHYTDHLIAPFLGNEELYKKRSPITWADRIDVPVLLLHGTNDRVVSIEQTKKLSKKLARNSVFYYEAEGHGFRDPENRFDALEREYQFYKGYLV